MFTSYIAITVLAAAATIYAAAVDFIGPKWILDNMTRYGVPHSWMPALGTLKALAALGLLVGIGVPLIGAAASVGLIIYFIGATATVVRARCYPHLGYPALYLLLAVASLVLRLASL
jgi:hypothetical protein